MDANTLFNSPTRENFLKYLASGRDINVKDVFDNSLLHLAITERLDDVIQILLEMNADMYCENEYGERPTELYYVSYGKNLEPRKPDIDKINKMLQDALKTVQPKGTSNIEHSGLKLCNDLLDATEKIDNILTDAIKDTTSNEKMLQDFLKVVQPERVICIKKDERDYGDEFFNSIRDDLRKEAQVIENRMTKDEKDRNEYIGRSSSLYPQIVHTINTVDESSDSESNESKVSELEDSDLLDVAKKLKEIEYVIEQSLTTRATLIEALKIDMDRLLTKTMKIDPPFSVVLKDHLDPILLHFSIENNNLSAIEALSFKRSRLAVIQTLGLEDDEMRSLEEYKSSLSK